MHGRAKLSFWLEMLFVAVHVSAHTLGICSAHITGPLFRAHAVLLCLTVLAAMQVPPFLTLEFGMWNWDNFVLYQVGPRISFAENEREAEITVSPDCYLERICPYRVTCVYVWQVETIGAAWALLRIYLFWRVVRDAVLVRSASIISICIRKHAQSPESTNPCSVTLSCLPALQAAQAPYRIVIYQC
jgi:hypothetical protein